MSPQNYPPHRHNRIILLPLSFFILIFAACLCHDSAWICSSESKNDPWRFAVISDTHVYPGGYGRTDSPGITGDVARSIVSDKADLVLMCGDLVPGGFGSYTDSMETKLTFWKRIASPLLDAGIPVYPVRGNHECLGKGVIEAWRNAFPSLPCNGPAGEEGLTYSFSHKNATFIGLDVYTSGIQNSAVNQNWLDSQLAGNTSTHVFVFGHALAFRVDSYEKNELFNDTVKRDTFWNSLMGAKVDAYFCGHHHRFNVSSIKRSSSNHDVLHIISGATGAGFVSPMKPVAYPLNNDPYMVTILYDNFDGPSSNPFGYILAEVDGDRITLQWKRGTYDANKRHWIFSSVYYTCIFKNIAIQKGKISIPKVITGLYYKCCELYQSP